MKYIRLGRSGLKVSRICIGTNMFGAGYVEDNQAISVINEAIEQGINFIDTSDSYYSGLSETIVGKAVKSRRQDFVVGTKGFQPTGPGVNDRGLSRKHIVAAVEASLRRLDTDYIDLYQVHFWDPDTPIDETLRTLDGLVRQGKIRYIGCSNFTAWQLCRALWISDKQGLERFESVQSIYNFSRRGIEEELFPLCLDQQVAITTFEVLMSGLLSGTYKKAEEPPQSTHMASRHASKNRYWNDSKFSTADNLKFIAEEAGHTPAQTVLAWALSKPPVTSLVIGASRPEQVVQNAASVDITLSEDLLTKLDNLE